MLRPYPANKIDLRKRDAPVTETRFVGKTGFLYFHKSSTKRYIMMAGARAITDMNCLRKAVIFRWGFGAIASAVFLCLFSPVQQLVNPLLIPTAQAQTSGERNTEADRLYEKGWRLFRSAQFRDALAIYQEVLQIRRALSDRAGEAETLNSIGEVYIGLSQYSQALEALQPALAIRKSTGDKVGEGETLNNLGVVYWNLGQSERAVEFYNQALGIHRSLGNKAGEGEAIANLGAVYQQQGEFSRALEAYQQALSLHRAVSEKFGEGVALSGIGSVYFRQGEYAQALEFYQQALAIHREIGDKAGEGVAIANLGATYQQLGQDALALESYQQSLAIVKETGDKVGEGIALGNVAFLLKQQNQPELAIAFYKQAINAIESIRQDLRSLPLEQQQSFAQTFVSTYRALADILLQQNRAGEAQQVLDLLKVQEIENYRQSSEIKNNLEREVETFPQEITIEQNYSTLQNQAIQLGKELAQLRAIPESDRVPAERERIGQLEISLQQARQQFNEFIRSPEIAALSQQLSQTSAQQNLSLRQLNSLRDNLRRLQQNAVLLYPLILENRLELVLVSPDAPPIHRSVAVTRQQLEGAIAHFRAALTNPAIEAKNPARQLYDWLIKPIETDLLQADAKTIIYAPDGLLRYIPLAALYDGSRWLAERFRINNITAASLTDFNTKPPAQPRVLAAAFTQGNYSFKVGMRQFTFAGLPFARVEVANIIAAIPTVKNLIDGAFTRKALIASVNDYNILHFATHAAFVPGSPQDSFILLGDGDRLTLQDIATWSLPDVDLVVLSACQTGVGGKLGSGEEILGFGYQIQETGARAAIASLWAVDDGGTQALMDAFYAALQKNNMTKAEALRLAQIALISGNYQALGEQRGIGVEQRARNTLSPEVVNRLSHPYYWAPFILIGNGL